MKDNLKGRKFTTNRGEHCEVISNIKSICVVKFEDGTVLEGIYLSNLLAGKVLNRNKKSLFDRGFIGYGEYKLSSNGGVAGKRWSGIFRRCYDPKFHLKNPSYKNCSVHEEWHNFQNFCQWFYEEYEPEVTLGWEIDKDILFPGNTVYQPSKCCLLPRQLHALNHKGKNSQSDLPLGVFKLKEGLYKASMSINNRYKHLGRFTCPEEAHQTYLNHKREYCLKTLLKWRGILKDRVYDQLENIYRQT